MFVVERQRIHICRKYCNSRTNNNSNTVKIVTRILCSFYSSPGITVPLLLWALWWAVHLGACVSISGPLLGWDVHADGFFFLTTCSHFCMLAKVLLYVFLSLLAPISISHPNLLYAVPFVHVRYYFRVSEMQKTEMPFSWLLQKPGLHFSKPPLQ